MINSKNLSIGFIGAGRVGCTLGRAFFVKKLHISGYFSNTYEHACEAADFTQSKPCKTIRELAEISDVIFITVPDSCICEVYLQLRKSDQLKDKILCHCSGALSAGIFKDIEAAGAWGFSVHPAFAVNDKENSYKEISKAFFTVEGSSEKMPVIENILKTMGNPYQIIEAESKQKYHAALAMASNLVIGIYRIALELLEECGFSDAAAQKVINPLFLNNAENVCRNDPLNALTGPVDRNDVSTVGKHLSVLKKEEDLELYRLLSRKLTEIAKEKYPERDYTDINRLLNKEKNF